MLLETGSIRDSCLFSFLEKDYEVLHKKDEEISFHISFISDDLRTMLY